MLGMWLCSVLGRSGIAFLEIPRASDHALVAFWERLVVLSFLVFETDRWSSCVKLGKKQCRFSMSGIGCLVRLERLS